MSLIVLRYCPDSLRDRNGRWYDVDFGKPVAVLAVENPHVQVLFGPTGRFEYRGNGERAEVYVPIESSPLAPSETVTHDSSSNPS